MFKFLGKLLDSNEKQINRLKPLVEQVNSFEEDIKKLKDKELAAKTNEFKLRLEKEETLDDILPEAFAVAREAIHRTVGERAFDVQLIAAAVLHQGKIAEQKTGEGKTHSAVITAYLDGLSGKGVHIVTVNDYLARRDPGWYGKALHLLGLKVGCIIHEQAFLLDPEFTDQKQDDEKLAHLRPVERKEAYLADVTYGTNNEFGFDYLRDNMAPNLKECTQRGYHFAIVDEVDSILIDEARTPLIISAPDTEPTQKYYDFASLIKTLSSDTDYAVDEKMRTANLTEHGILKVEKRLGVKNLYEKDFETIHHIEQALKAKTLFQQDRDYVVKDGQVIIVDEFTGRLMFGRRYSEGLHQAIEAKEGVQIQQESRTLATVSFQNYFRLYEKLAGMTGTAATESEEFEKIYKLEVIIVPTNEDMIRINNPDVVYKTTRAKYNAVVEEIVRCHKEGQPVLVGTTSIDKNEIIDEFLKRKGIPHEVLNAKNHQREAAIIAQAGKKGAVTVATNMAGRGVDIILGGALPDKSTKEETKIWQRDHQEVVKRGGLHIVGTERHEARRIDNQLRGRSGRQGDPGSSRFFVALDDDIMRLFGGEQVAKIMTVFKMPENIPIEHKMISKAIEQAQGKVEGFNFDARKHLVEYDDVLNKQREIIYQKRQTILEQREAFKESKKTPDSPLKEEILDKITTEITNIVNMYSPEGFTTPECDKIINDFVLIIPFETNSQSRLKTEIEKLKSPEKIITFLTQTAQKTYEQREKQISQEIMREVEVYVILSTIDKLWMDHLDAIDDLREGIGLRGYAQRDPLVEYKNEAFTMFERLIANIDYEVVRKIFRIQVAQRPAPIAIEAEEFKPPPTIPTQQQENIDTEDGVGLLAQKMSQLPQASAQATPGRTLQKNRDPRTGKKIGRNDSCWCGSGKKFKKCHGR
jgi:preprotein translocase subunit SecA